MTTLGNPVPGRIQAKTEPWAGTPTFRVTATFADHGGRAAGIDFGNGRCGDAVLAMEGGTCSVTRDPNGAIIVRIKHAGLHSSGYAHLSMALVKTGQVVARGDRIGLVGKTGASACHLHAGYTIGGREVDFWPLLEQNQEDDSMTIVTLHQYPEGTRTWSAAGGKTTGYKADGATKTVTLTAGSKAQATGTADISQDPPKAPQGHGFVLLANGALAGYYVLPTAGTVAPAPPVYTQAQLDAAVKDAEKGASRDVAEAAVDEAVKYG